MSKYVIGTLDDVTHGFYINLYYRIVKGFVLETRICPTIFPNKKKAKRVLKRLNKYHGDCYFLIRYDK